MRAHILLLPAVASLLGRPADAAETLGVVAVAEPPGPSAELAELTHQFRDVLAERTQGVVEANVLRERMAGQPSSATLAELDRAYAGALATYQNGDFEGAIRTLQAVIQDLERLPPSTEAFDQWTRAMLRLGRAQGSVGRKADSRATLETLLRAAPNAKADPTQYPPSFEKQLADVRVQLKALPRHRLKVTAARPAKVFVEGREVGTTPVSVDLPAGRYRVAGVQGSLRVPGVVADLGEEDQAIVLDFSIAEALRPGFGPGLALTEAERAKGVITTGAWLGVDRLITTRFATDADVTLLVGTIYDVRRGMLQREGRVRLLGKSPPPGSLSALATFLITGQASSLVATTSVQPTEALAAVPPGPKGPTPAEPPGPPKKQSGALGWTSFASGILAVGLGTVAVVEGVTASNYYSTAKNAQGPNGALMPGVDPAAYDDYISKGDSAKSVAIATGVGAAVFLVTGVVTGYFSVKETGTIGPIRF